MEILTGSGSSGLDTLKLELGLGSKKIGLIPPLLKSLLPQENNVNEVAIVRSRNRFESESVFYSNKQTKHPSSFFRPKFAESYHQSKRSE